jgi:hypothetical protein
LRGVAINDAGIKRLLAVVDGGCGILNGLIKAASQVRVTHMELSLMSQWGNFPKSLSCPVVHKAWKGMWKEWEFCTCPLIDNGNIQLDMGNYVNGTFSMEDGNMLHGSFL